MTEQLCNTLAVCRSSIQTADTKWTTIKKNNSHYQNLPSASRQCKTNIFATSDNRTF